MDTTLSNLYDKIKRCKDCSLHHESVNDFRISSKLGTSDVLIISQNPSCYKTKDSIVMGGFDKLHSKELDRELEKCYITNIIKCSFNSNKVPTDIDDIIYCCTKWLLDEIRLIKPKLIVVSGKIAREYFPLKEILRIVPDVEITYVSHPLYYVYTGKRKQIIDLMLTILKKYNTTQEKL